ncbi:MAG: hypothetical protein JW834_04485 [Candidatus Diapherotrites archaeon]|nr:hypothetical protein [Candidatus Diapherotrites archaeon]
MRKRIRRVREALHYYDPSQVVIRRLKLTGVKAEVADVAVSLLLAAIFYYLVMPVLVGANPAAVVVQSCSMRGTLNVGDISVLRGAAWDDVSAPEIAIASPIHFSVEPNSIYNETEFLLFPDGQRLAVHEDGDVIVYNSKISGQQIIHRVIAKVTASDGRFYLTKGDNNTLPDAARIGCAVWEEAAGIRECVQVKKSVDGVCSDADAGWPGCLGTPLREDEIVGKVWLNIPVFGHVKMLFFHVITLGHGYPAEFWC